MRPLFFLAMLFSAYAAEALDPTKRLSQYKLDSWDKSAGLVTSGINDLLQTSDGYFWIATFSGLYRFDGVVFTHFHRANTPAIVIEDIRRLCETPDSTLWIGVNGGGLLSYKNGLFTRYSTADGLLSDVVLGLLVDASRQLWVATNLGVQRFENGKFVPVTTIDGKHISPYKAMLNDRNGQIWFGSSGLYRFNGERLVPHQAVSGLVVTRLYHDRNGTLWIGTVGKGVFTLKNDSLAVFGASVIGNENVWDIEIDPDNNVWISTDNGLFRYNEQVGFSSLSEKNGLNGSVIFEIFLDREGGIWIGGYQGGLQRLSDGKFLNYTTKEGIASGNVYCVFAEPDGGLWMGGTGGIAFVKQNIVATYPASATLPFNSVRAIHRSRNGTLWVATYGKGLFSFDNGVVQPFRFASLVSASMRALLEDRNGALWFTMNGGIGRCRNDSLKVFTAKDGLENERGELLYEDASGLVWFGTDGGGLYAARGDSIVKKYTTKNGLAANVVFGIHQDQRGAMWICTNGGLSRITNDSVFTFTTSHGLPTNNLYCVLEDDAESLWISTSDGIMRVSIAALNRVAEQAEPFVETELYTTDDGMPTEGGTTPATACKTRDGWLWFPTVKGAVGIHPSKLQRNTYKPPIYIATYLADADTIINGQAIAPGKQRHEFHFSVLSFPAPAKMRVRYKLEGFDKSWVDAGRLRTATYTNLAPGEYVFKVVGSNNDGVWNDVGAAFAFRVLPHFYQTWWFIGLCVAATIGGSVGAVHYRTRLLRARQKELERAVETRTEELARLNQDLLSAKNAIQEKNLALEQAFQSIQISKAETDAKNAELAHINRELRDANQLKSELLSIAAHDLKNPLQSILGFAQLLQEDAPIQSVSQAAEVIKRASERMLKLIGELLESAAIDAGRLELHRQLMDFSALAEVAIEQNISQARAKSQRIQAAFASNLIVHIDQERMKEVLDNLVSNAIKYSPHNTTITVTTERAVYRGASGGAHEVARLIVKDEGQGLDQDDLKKMFGRFQRLSAKPTGGESSTGLGLSIVKQLVDLHGGRVWAESEGRGKGSAFFVELPLENSV